MSSWQFIVCGTESLSSMCPQLVQTLVFVWGKRIHNISSVTRNIFQEYFICDKNLRLLSFSPSHNIISLVAFFGNLECDNLIGSDSNNLSYVFALWFNNPYVKSKPWDIQPRQIGHLIYLNRTVELTGSKKMAFHTPHLGKCALALKYKRCWTRKAGLFELLIICHLLYPIFA